MSYMLLIMEEPGERLAPPEPERRRRWDVMLAFAGELEVRGKLRTANALALPGRETVRLRKRGQNHAMVDGPFAEAKEIVGGFFYLDVETRDEAIAIAEQCPAVEWSTVEVRKIAPCFEDTQ
jgi:hypothetical protein